MYKTLKALYDSFYKPLEMEKAVQETSDAHRQLISHLDKADRKLVLQIIDAKDFDHQRQFIGWPHLRLSTGNKPYK